MSRSTPLCPERSLRIDEVARILSVDPRTVRNLLNAEKLQSIWVRGHRRVLKSDVARFLSQGVRDAADEEGFSEQLPDDALLRPEAVADALNVSRHTVMRMIEEGELPAVDISQGGRPTLRVSAGFLDHLRRARRR